jgi:hypothetical protein
MASPTESLGFDTSNEDPITFDPTDSDFMCNFLNVLHPMFEHIVDFWWID